MDTTQENKSETTKFPLSKVGTTKDGVKIFTIAFDIDTLIKARDIVALAEEILIRRSQSYGNKDLRRENLRATAEQAYILKSILTEGEMELRSYGL